MSVDSGQLKEKILEIYPEIGKHDLGLDISFDKEKDTWIVKLKKGENELYTHLEKTDAEDCVNGVKCIYLGNQIAQFVEAYCMGSDACAT